MKKKLLIIGGILLILLGVPAFLFGTGIYVWIDSVPIRYALCSEDILSKNKDDWGIVINDLTTIDIKKAEKVVRGKHIYRQSELDEIKNLTICINLDPSYPEHEDIDLSELKYFHNLESLALRDRKLDELYSLSIDLQMFTSSTGIKYDELTNYKQILEQNSLTTGLDQLYKLKHLEDVGLYNLKIDSKANFGEIKGLDIWFCNLESLDWIERLPTLERLHIHFLPGNDDFSRDFKKKIPNLTDYREFEE